MNRNLYILISLIIGILLGSVATAEVYKTVDKNGRVTYTDVPPADTAAKPVELKSINNIPAPPPAPVTYAPATPADAPKYELQILAPENGKTLLADERSVTVSVGVNQSLQNGYQFAYKLDGTTVQTTAEMSYIIVEPPRGEHVLTVEVVDSEGKSVAQSNPVTIVVMRPMVKQKVVPVPKK